MSLKSSHVCWQHHNHWASVQNVWQWHTISQRSHDPGSGWILRTRLGIYDLLERHFLVLRDVLHQKRVQECCGSSQQMRFSLCDVRPLPIRPLRQVINGCARAAPANGRLLSTILPYLRRYHVFMIALTLCSIHFRVFALRNSGWDKEEGRVHMQVQQGMRNLNCDWMVRNRWGFRDFLSSSIQSLAQRMSGVLLLELGV